MVMTLLMVFHTLVALGLIGFILLQQGKGAEAGAGFGAGASGTIFGSRGATSFLSRTTAVLATFFFCSSLALNILMGRAALQDSGIPVASSVEKKDNRGLSTGAGIDVPEVK